MDKEINNAKHNEQIVEREKLDYQDEQILTNDIQQQSSNTEFQASTMAVGEPPSDFNSINLLKELPGPAQQSLSLNAPFAYGQNMTEYISPSTGALEYTITDLVFPGKNGFDLIIKRRYDSSIASTEKIRITSDKKTMRYWRYRYAANLYEKHGHYASLETCKEQGMEAAREDGAEGTLTTPMTDGSIKRYFTKGKANNHFIDLYGLGYGWHFCFPSIEEGIQEVNDKGDLIEKDKLYLGDGRSFLITKESNQYVLEDYDLKDIEIKRASNNGPYSLHYKDGKAVYFNSNNVIDYMCDRFENKIYFTFTSKKRLQSITDTFGRVLTYESDGDNLLWKLDAQKQFEYKVEKNKLTNDYDKAGRITKYSYTEQIGKTIIFQKIAGDSGCDFTFYNLTNITYPTNASVQYTYKNFIEYSGIRYLDDTYREFYTVVNRKYIPRTAGMPASMNEVNYQYSDILPDFVPERQKSYITTSTRKEVDGNTTTYKFRSSRLCYSEEVKDNTGRKVSDKTISYTSKVPTYERSTIYNPKDNLQFYTVEKSNPIDSKGNVKSEKTIIKKSDGTLLHEQEINYEYDPLYSILTKRSYKKDDSITITEYNDVPSGGKVVTCQRVLEGTVLKEKTDLIHDEDRDYNLIEQRRYHNLSTNAYYSTHFEYNSPYTSQPTKNWVNGVLDCDNQQAWGGGNVTESFAYDAYGRLEKKIDPTGAVTVIEYDNMGRVTEETISNAAGTESHKRITKYWDSGSTPKNHITVTDERGAQTRYEYTPLGNISKVYLLGPELLTASYEYDSRGRLQKQKSYPGGSLVTTTYEYDVLDRIEKQTTSVADSTVKDHVEEYAYGDALEGWYFQVVKTVKGEPSVPDPDMVAYQRKDVLGQIIEEGVGNPTAGGHIYKVKTAFDKMGNVVTKTDNAGVVTKWSCDYAGRVTSETRDYGTTVAVTCYTIYDALGNKVSFKDFEQNTTDWTYNSLGQMLTQTADFVSETQRAKTWYGYDKLGNVTLERTLCGKPGDNSTTRETRYSYNFRGWPEETAQTDNGSEVKSRQQYDAGGNRTKLTTGITSATPNGLTTLWTYNRFGGVETITDPENRQEVYSYNSYGRLDKRKDREGRFIVYSYDGLSRVKKEEAQDAAGKSLGVSTSYEYYASGRKKLERNENITVTCAYDREGRVVKLTETGDGNTVVKEYSYHNHGGRKSFKLTRNNTVEVNLEYTYDRQNRLETVTKVETDGAKTLLAQYSYYPNGTRKALTYPAGNVGSVSYKYNKAGLITELVNTSRTGALSTHSYTYYLDGNQQSKKVDGKTTSYEYDKLGRLTRESESDGWTMRYTYDANSNRKRLEVTGGEGYTVDYVYNKNNWLVTETKVDKAGKEISYYRYDRCGNQCSRETERFEPAKQGDKPGKVGFGSDPELVLLELREYNGFNQLSMVYRDGETTRYSYRPDGLRQGKRHGDSSVTTHLWDGENIVADVGAGVYARYLRGAGLIALEKDKLLNYYFHNAHGDVAHLANSWGDELEGYKYDAFGVEQGINHLDTNPFRYCGEYFDAETEEIYLRARYYNPRTGRFGAEDVLRLQTLQLYNGQAVLNNASLNLYLYCFNNPLRYVDPSGNKTLDQIKIENDDNNVIRIKINKNVINIYADVKFYGDYDKKEKETNKTYRELALEGIEEYWNKKFTDVYGKDVTVKTHITDHTGEDGGLFNDQKMGKIYVNDKQGQAVVRYPTKGTVWAKERNMTMHMYTYEQKALGGNIRNADDFKWTVAHEFGHFLGVRDAYNKDAKVKSIFNVRGTPVQSKDIMKVLDAFQQNVRQEWN